MRKNKPVTTRPNFFTLSRIGTNFCTHQEWIWQLNNTHNTQWICLDPLFGIDFAQKKSETQRGEVARLDLLSSAMGFHICATCYSYRHQSTSDIFTDAQNIAEQREVLVTWCSRLQANAAPLVFVNANSLGFPQPGSLPAPVGLPKSPAVCWRHSEPSMHRTVQGSRFSALKLNCTKTAHLLPLGPANWLGIAVPTAISLLITIGWNIAGSSAGVEIYPYERFCLF